MMLSMVAILISFLSTLSLRRATKASLMLIYGFCISIHALLAESDTDGLFFIIRRNNFYPRSPCGERRVTVLGIQHRVGISIHALLAESDLLLMAHQVGRKFLSTLSLRRATCQWRRSVKLFRQFLSTLSLRRATTMTTIICTVSKFLSTLSLRRATCLSIFRQARASYFYPRSPCGERHAPSFTPTASRNFYPRSPCGERPLEIGENLMNRRHFYPRSPCGERLDTSKDIIKTVNFYPRSPCGERRLSIFRQARASYFYPRSPCGERPMTSETVWVIIVFLSTLSLRRATRGAANCYLDNIISIHALLAESDSAELRMF